MNELEYAVEDSGEPVMWFVRSHVSDEEFLSAAKEHCDRNNEDFACYEYDVERIGLKQIYLRCVPVPPPYDQWHNKGDYNYHYAKPGRGAFAATVLERDF